MDPDACLREARSVAAELLQIEGDDDRAERLAELVTDLDAWIVKGGFLPRRWGGAGAADDELGLVAVVAQALKPCGLTVERDSGAAEHGRRWAVVCVDDSGAFRIGRGLGVVYARHLSAAELSRWADGWLACWRVWGGGKG